MIAVLGISLYFRRLTRAEGHLRNVTHLWSSLCRQRQQQNSSESRTINRKETRLPAAITPILWLGSERRHPGDSGCATFPCGIFNKIRQPNDHDLHRETYLRDLMSGLQCFIFYSFNNKDGTWSEQLTLNHYLASLRKLGYSRP